MAIGPGHHRTAPRILVACARGRSQDGASQMEGRDRQGPSLAATGVAGLAGDYPGPLGHHVSRSSAGWLPAGARAASELGRVLVGAPVTVVGVGIDLVDLERIRALLASKGEYAMARFFSDREREYLGTRADATGHAAARIAAKEAVYKAMQALPGARGVGLREIEVRREA